MKKNTETSSDFSIGEVLHGLNGYFKYLKANIIYILFFAVVGAILGFVYANNKRPIYTAVTTFVLEDSDRGVGQYAGIASMVGIDLGSSGGGIFQGDNILELYKSKKMIQKALLTKVQVTGSKELLIDRYINLNNLREKWSATDLAQISFEDRSMSKPINAKLLRIQDSLINVFVNDINTNYLSVGKPDKKLNLIKAEVKSSDEIFSKNFNDQIVKNVNDFYIMTKVKKSTQNIEILQQKTDSVRNVMNGSISLSARITDATPNLNASKLSLRAIPFQRSQFSGETNRAILTELVKNLELSKISLRRETPLIQVVDEPVFPLEIIKFGKIKFSLLGFIISASIICLYLFIKRLVLISLADDL